MAFVLFVLVTGALFFRPGEFSPSLATLPLYEVLIISCLVVSFPRVVAQLTPANLGRRPVTLAVLAMLPSIVASDLAHLRLEAANTHGTEFAKIALYYLLLVGVVDTPVRLRRFLASVALFALIPTVFATLQYHHMINLPAFDPIMEGGYDEFYEWSGVVRLKGGDLSVFDDPNDMSLLLATGMMICAGGILRRGAGLSRLIWLPILPIFGYAFMLTRSRGGFLALLVAGGLMIRTRYGRRATILMGVLGLPLLLLMLSGRMTSLSTSDGTGQQRIQIWFEGLILFQRNPILGVGQDQYAENIGLVAHNSFIQCFTELGFVGGAIFLGAFYCAIASLWKRGQGEFDDWLDPELLRLRPYITAIVAGNAAGMLTLSRSYLVPTYMILGMAAAFDRIADREIGEPALTLSPRLVVRVIGLSLGFLAGMHVFVYRHVHW